MLSKVNSPYNIVLISIDCLRYNTTHSLIRDNKIPNIKRLSEKGLFFKQAISTAPWTAPSISSILTSTYPLMYDGFVNFSPRKSFVGLLRKAGFSTTTCQTNPFLSKFFGFDKGFSAFVDGIRESQSLFTRVERIRVFRKLIPKGSSFGDFLRFLSLFLSKYLDRYPDPYVTAKQLTSANLKLIERSPRPFFAWIHYMDAHQPHDPYESDLMSSYKFGRIQHKLRKNERLSMDEISWLFTWYKDSILHIDKSIGTLLLRLEEIGMTFDNTYFILTSDHGQEFFEHERFGHTFRLYDELIRIPLIIAGPELSHGSVSQQVSLIDLPPTMLGLLNLSEKIPVSYLGRDLSQLLKESSIQIPKYPAISEVGIRSGKSEIDSKSRILKLDLRHRKTSYRFDNWKYIYKENDPDELYDLTRDPNEHSNLVEEEKEQAADFLGRIKQHIRMEEKTKREQEEYLRILSLSRKLRSRI